MKPRMLNTKPTFTGRGIRHANDGTPDKPEAIIATLAAELKQRLGTHLRGLWLFGSRARGDARLNSDYDLLILVDESSAELRDRILDLQVEMLDRHDALVATPAVGRGLSGRPDPGWSRSSSFGTLVLEASLPLICAAHAGA